MDQRVRFILWLFVIFLVAVATRAYLVRYTYIFGYDSYWFARMISYVIRWGHVPEKDPLTWWGFREKLGTIRWELSMYIPAWIYTAIFGSNYNRMNLLTVLKWLPAVFGALGSVFTALMVTVVAGPLAGVLSGIFAATNPAYIYRTMSGFYEDDASSFWIPLTFFFAFLAIREHEKKKKGLYLLAAGLSSLAGALSWTGYLIVGYAFLVFIALAVAYTLIHAVGRRIKTRHAVLAALVLSVITAVALDLVIESWAYEAAGKAYEFLGRVPDTIQYIIAVPTLATVLMAIFACLAVFAYHRKSATLAAYAIATFILVVPICHYVAVKGFSTTIRTPSGLELPVTLPPGIPGGALSILFGGALVFLLSSLAGAFSALLFIPPEKSDGIGQQKAVFLAYVVVILFALFALPLNGFNILGPVVHFVLRYNPEQVLAPQAQNIVSATVGEETFGFLNWPAKYGVLAFLVFLTIPLLVYKGREDPRYWILLAWFVVGWYSAWSKLKYTYYLGIPVSFAVGIFLADIAERVPKDVWKGALRWSYAFAIMLIVFSMLGTGIYHTVSRIPSLLSPEDVNNTPFIPPGSDSRDYIEAFNFIEQNIPPGSVILNWWNLGHWLTFWTEHNVATDNTNAVWEADRTVALFFISPEEKAYRIAREYNYDYVFFERGYAFSQLPFAVYAFETPNTRDKRMEPWWEFVLPCSQRKLLDENVYFCSGFSNGRWQISPDLWFSIVSFTPTDRVLPNAGPAVLRISNTDVNLYRMANALRIPENVWKAIPPLSPFTWTPSDRAFAKLFIAGRMFVVYRMGNSLVLLGPGANDSVSMKMYLGITEKFEPVFISSRGQVVIYKVKK